MANIFLAVDEKDKTYLEQTIKRRHSVNEDRTITSKDTLKNFDFVLFDPAFLRDWKDICQETESIDFIAMGNKEQMPELRELLDSGVISYFYTPYQTHHVMNLFDKILRYKGDKSKNNILILDNEEEFLDKSRKKLQEKYEIITAMSPEAVYEIVWANRIDATLLLNHHIFDKQVEKDISEVLPFSEFVYTSEAKSQYKTGRNIDFASLEENIEKALTNKRFMENEYKPQDPKVHTIMGPRASGKTTLVDNLANSLPYMHKALRIVSREPREYEIQGEDHLFMRDKDIKKHSEELFIYEHKKGYLVGINKDVIKDNLEEGNDVLLTLAESSHYKGFEKDFPVKPLMVLSPSKELQIRTFQRDSSNPEIEETIRDYLNCHICASKNNMKIIYNPEPGLRLHQPSYSPSKEEFDTIAQFVKQGRQFISENRPY